MVLSRQLYDDKEMIIAQDVVVPRAVRSVDDNPDKEFPIHEWEDSVR
jgi:hypothetical protein